MNNALWCEGPSARKRRIGLIPCVRLRRCGTIRSIWPPGSEDKCKNCSVLSPKRSCKSGFDAVSVDWQSWAVTLVPEEFWNIGWVEEVFSALLIISCGLLLSCFSLLLEMNCQLRLYKARKWCCEGQIWKRFPLLGWKDGYFLGDHDDCSQIRKTLGSTNRHSRQNPKRYTKISSKIKFGVFKMLENEWALKIK